MTRCGWPRSRARPAARAAGIRSPHGTAHRARHLHRHRHPTGDRRTQLLAPTPGTPAEPPLLAALLAFVRRQFVNDTPTVTSTVPRQTRWATSPSASPRLTTTAINWCTRPPMGPRAPSAINPDGHSFTYNQTPARRLRHPHHHRYRSTDPHIHGLAGLINALSLGLLGDAGHESAATTKSPSNSTPRQLCPSRPALPIRDGTVTVTMVAMTPTATRSPCGHPPAAETPAPSARRPSSTRPPAPTPSSTPRAMTPATPPRPTPPPRHRKPTASPSPSATATARR